MNAFENTIVTKEEMLKELKKHQELDSFMKGTYDDKDEDNNFKGCAVGCSLESASRLKGLKIKFGDHKEYENLMNIPEWLARVEDTLFEGVSLERSKQWPVEFIEAINVGADLEKVKAPFLIFVLKSNLERLQDDKFKQQREAVLGSIALWEREDMGSKEFKESARSAADAAAWSAAESARSAADAAARSAAWSAAESAAWSAAWSAAESARSAAWSAAWSAAESARSAADAAAESAAWSAAWSAAFENFADKLLDLIKECD